MAVGILLVGGFGTRLMPLTKNTPKPMLTVAGLPVTEHQLAMAKRGRNYNSSSCYFISI